MDFFSLKNKVAIITGGTSGIGLATARRFAAAGAKVTIVSRSDGAQIAREIGARHIRADVAQEPQVAAFVDEVAKQEGRIDVMVNNAGYGQVGGETADLTQDALDKHLAVNLHGVLYGIKYASRHMGRGGSIVVVASLAGVLGMPGYSAYVASKWAVLGLARSAAIELGPKGIRVNALCPGTIDTPMNAAGGADAELTLVKALAPLGRIGSPEEMAAAIHFLASDDSGYITGTELIADGGWYSGVSIGAIEAVMNGA